MTMCPKAFRSRSAIAELPRLLEEPRLLHRALDDRGERLEVERLREVVLGALLHRGDRARDRAEGRHHDEHRARRRRARLLHERDAVEARHLQVRQDDVGAELLQLAERLEAVGGRLGGVALVAEDLASAARALASSSTMRIRPRVAMGDRQAGCHACARFVREPVAATIRWKVGNRCHGTALRGAHEMSQAPHLRW